MQIGRQEGAVGTRMARAHQETAAAMPKKAAGP